MYIPTAVVSARAISVAVRLGSTFSPRCPAIRKKRATHLSLVEIVKSTLGTEEVTEEICISRKNLQRGLFYSSTIRVYISHHLNH